MTIADPRVLVFTAVLMQASAQGLMSGRVTPADSLLFAVIAFGSSALVYLTALRLRGARADRPPVPPTWRLMVAMNVLTAVTFIGFYLSLTLIPASTTSALTTAVGPATVGLTLLVTRRASPANSHMAGLTPAKWAFAAALCAVAGVLAVWSWDAGGAGSAATAAGGVLLAVCAGWGMASITVLSRRLGDVGVSALTVTAHRFHLTYGTAAVLWLASGDGVLPPGARLLSLAGYGAIAVVAPLFLLQIGVQRVDPLAAMMIIVTGPSIVYLVQVVTGAAFDAITLLLILSVIGLSAGYRVYDQRRAARSVG